MALAREVAQLHKEGVKLHFVGARENLAANVRKGFAEAEELTLNNTSLTLNVCFNYGGRWDIVDAAARLARDGVPITVESMSNAVCLANGPEPDLFIRTGGEMRLSNFLLWQAAYSELYFSDLLWPDFDAAALDMAIAEFSLRERRFGKISQPTVVSTDAHS
jgi:undecaprenyl diphosphate synthase